MSENIAAPDRDISIVTLEIKTLQNRARNTAIGCAIEIGRRLVEAKSLLKHGQWGNWLKTEFEYSQATADNLMKIFEQYGSTQISIFGEVNSQALGNIGITKALQLIAIPEAEREDFIKENNVENISTRNLDRIIKERDEAQRRAQDAEAKAEQALRDVGVSSELNYELTKKMENAKKMAEEAEDEAFRLEQELKALKARPIEVAIQAPDEATLNKIRSEAEAAAAKKQQEIEKKLAQAEKKLEAAQKEQEKLKKEREDSEKKLVQERDEAKKKLEQASSTTDAEREALAAKNEELKKQLAVADPVTAQFKVLFEEAQELMNKLLGLTLKADECKRDNLRKALSAMLSGYGEKVKAVE